MERIAATLTSAAHARRGPDHVVHPAARRAQPRVGGDRLGLVERRAASPSPSGRISVGAPRAARTSRPCPPGRSRWARRRPCRRASGTPARPWCASSARAAGSAPAARGGRVEDEELALARVDLEASRRRRGAPPRRRAGPAQLTTTRQRVTARRLGASSARPSPIRVHGGHATPRPQLGAVLARPRPRARACRRPGRSPIRPGPRASRRRAASTVDAVALAFAASAATAARSLVARGAQRARRSAGPARRAPRAPGRAARPSAGSARSPARPGVESKPVWRIPELVPLAGQPGLGLGLEQRRPRRRGGPAPARRRQPTTPAPTTATSASTGDPNAHRLDGASPHAGVGSDHL